MIDLIDLRAITAKLLRLGMLGGTLIGVTACGRSDYSDLEQYVAEVKARPASGIEPLPQFTPVEMFSFDAEGLRDPFSPVAPADLADEVELAGEGAVRPDLNRPREELETYPLDGLRMVGTVNLGGVQWGLVRASDGTIHRVREGNYLGRNHGRILRILGNRIEIMEIIPEGRPGRWRERQASLALAE